MEILKQKLKALMEEKADSLDYHSKLLEQSDVLSALEAKASKQDELIMLKKLVSVNEALKAQESAFKLSCKAQMQDYNSRIQALEEAENENDEEIQKLRDIEDMHTKVKRQLFFSPFIIYF